MTSGGELEVGIGSAAGSRVVEGEGVVHGEMGGGEKKRWREGN